MDTDRWHCWGLHRSSGHSDHQCSDDLCTCPLLGMPITGSPLLCQPDHMTEPTSSALSGDR
ncbi:unnamed protein product [Staurois parvus]|uniref:Uncharacterized protein n=1 Tax=Staurois parvus TaxID=386267 RepID=A0ABN9DDN9_9NEOB|nr:unnamed protein product [Staurois parvus]